MVAAGLLARNAVARGLAVPPTVKTSLAPGSRAVTEYLRGADLMEPLEKLGFALAGYGCTTCIGNSGPLDAPVAQAIEENDLVVAAVLSGNRNFEGRIHPARTSQLSGLAAARRGLRAGRHRGHRPHDAAARHRRGRQAGLPARPLAVRRRRSGRPSGRRSTASCSGAPTPRSSTAGRSGRRSTCPPAIATAGTPPRPMSPGRRSSSGSGASPSRWPHPGRSRPGGPRRLGDDRPHLAGRLDRGLVARRRVAPGARRAARRVQQLRGSARPPRSHDARHLRQHPAAQRPGRARGAVHGPPARRRAR